MEGELQTVGAVRDKPINRNMWVLFGFLIQTNNGKNEKTCREMWNIDRCTKELSGRIKLLWPREEEDRGGVGWGGTARKGALFEGVGAWQLREERLLLQKCPLTFPSGLRLAVGLRF